MVIELNIPDDAPRSEFSFAFIQGMLRAMFMSFFKYGLVAEAYPAKVNALESLRKRLEKYEETGNAEFLIDVANFAMIEFMHPRHLAAHFNPSDSSIGRVWNNGQVSEESNTLSGENVRRGGTSLTTAGGFYQREGD